jgi:DNA adenine methylase
MAFSYIGGKNRMGEHIAQFIPRDITTYVEPFSGAFWVYLHMNLDNFPNLTRIVYNDINPANANIFRCLQHPEEFSKYLAKEECQTKDVLKEGQACDPKFAEKFYTYQKNVYSKELSQRPDFEWGVQYAYVITQVFSGSRPETSSFIDLKHKYNSKFDAFRKRVAGLDNNLHYQESFKKISLVECADFQSIIEQYDNNEGGQKTYFYCDPPYYKTEDYYSRHNFDIKTHSRLAKVLQNIKYSRFSLSYYDFPDLQVWFPEDDYYWDRKLFKKAAAARKGCAQTDGEELLIMNY